MRCSRSWSAKTGRFDPLDGIFGVSQPSRVAATNPTSTRVIQLAFVRVDGDDDDDGERLLNKLTGVVW